MRWLDRAVTELEARSARPAGDLPATPLELAKAISWTPDPWQRGVLASEARRLALRCCRQSGKSTVVALLGLAELLRGGLTLALSPTERQSVELLRKVKDFLRVLPSPVATIAESTVQVELANGGRIVALPGHDEGHIRGFSGVDLLLVDEASRVPDVLYQAARPMLAVSGGRIVLLSTPFGRRGFFWREFEDGDPGWHRVTVTADDVPRISPDFLEEERRALGPLVFASEYEVKFVDTEQSAFDSAEVWAALDSSIRPLFPSGVAA